MVNINQFMKQAQLMQKKMQELQEEVANKQFEVQSGGGMVKMVVNGRGEVQKVEVDESLLNPKEKEMLEDLIVAACNEAKSKVDKESSGSMSDAFSGMSLPSGFKLPF